MDEDPPESELAARVSAYIAVFAAMLGATIAGQLLGIVVDAALHCRSPWPPAACSIALEGIAGGWVAASRRGHSLSPLACARLSAGYSLALIALTAPLAVWTAAAQAASGRGPVTMPAGSVLAHLTPATFAMAAVAAVFWTVLRSPVVFAASAWRAGDRRGRP